MKENKAEKVVKVRLTREAAFERRITLLCCRAEAAEARAEAAEARCRDIERVLASIAIGIMNVGLELQKQADKAGGK